MGIKSLLSKPLAWITARNIRKSQARAVADQEKIFQQLLHTAKYTRFGKDHHFASIQSHNDFVKQVPVQDYEGLKPYIELIKNGEQDVLWPGKPLYFAKTSGTTSGVKYIPISKESMPEHIRAARNALLCYIAETGKADFVNGKMIFLQGSPEMDTTAGIQTGRLSGIVAHHVPNYLQANRLPSYSTNCIEDWEEKVDAIVEETIAQNMTLISGIPPWVQMYFDKLSEQSNGKKIEEIFPNFSLFVYGGVNFEPYRAKLEASIGRKIDSIETYPASEGFLAFQDSQQEPGLLLNTNAGMFFEFIPTEEYFNEQPTRLSLSQVELNKNYALVLNTNAGLWGYSIGDTIKFISKEPYRILVTGRIKHFISAFGEHVIGEEVEKALNQVIQRHSASVIEFTVAPQVNDPEGGLPFHEWFIEFDRKPMNMDLFRSDLDAAMQQLNVYYFDLIEGKILQQLKIKELPKDSFIRYMKEQGKLGGQNKVPRLSNDRAIAEVLGTYC